MPNCSYLEFMRVRLQRWPKKYPKAGGFCLFSKMLAASSIFCGRYLLDYGHYFFKKEDKKRLSVALVLSGGIGDIVTAIRYIHVLLAHTNAPVVVDVFSSQKPSDIAVLLGAAGLRWQVFPMHQFKNRLLYDIVIQLSVQFPVFFVSNQHKLDVLAPALSSYIAKARQWNKAHEAYLSVDNMFRAQYWCVLNKKTMLQAMDTPDLLNLSNVPPVFLQLPLESQNMLKRWNLQTRPFITVGYSVDQNNPSKLQNIRLYQHWPEVLRLLKKKYPSLYVVQLGGFPHHLDGVDLCLAGKTSFSELISLLGYSYCHLDNDSGFVHLRHFFSGKPSVVLFGCTSAQVKGHAENLNLVYRPCNMEVCEWLEGNTWWKTCPGNLGPNHCMGFKPQWLAEQIVASGFLDLF